MRRFVLASAVLALCSTTTAQSTYSPLPAFQSMEGPSYARLFGVYSNGRYHMADGNFHNTLPIVSSVAFRPDGVFSYYSYYGTGRTWSNVTLDMSNTKLSQVKGATGITWSSNHLSPPVRVFSSSVTWPTRNGIPTGNVTNWNDHGFTFTTPWIRSAALPDKLDADMLMDFQFTGGTLANNLAWSSTFQAQYNLDAWNYATANSGIQTFLFDNTTRGCTDSRARPPFLRAYCYLYAYTYSKTYANTNLANKMRFYQYGYYMAPSSPYVARLSLANIPSGLPYGAGCEKLYLTGSIIAIPGTTDTYGGTGLNDFGLPNGIPYNAGLVGLKVTLQNTWSDTVTSAAMISAACVTPIVDHAPFGHYLEALRIARYSPTKTGSATGLNLSWAHSPICKYN